MNNGDYDRIFSFAAGLLLGAVIGAGVALVMAPEAGQKTRRKIRKAAGELREATGDRWEELSDEVKERVDDVLAGARKRFGSS